MQHGYGSCQKATLLDMNVVEFSQPLQSVCIQILLFFIFVPKCHEDLYNFSDKLLACSTGDALTWGYRWGSFLLSCVGTGRWPWHFVTSPGVDCTIIVCWTPLCGKSGSAYLPYVHNVQPACLMLDLILFLFISYHECYFKVWVPLIFQFITFNSYGDVSDIPNNCVHKICCLNTSFVPMLGLSFGIFSISSSSSKIILKNVFLWAEIADHFAYDFLSCGSSLGTMALNKFTCYYYQNSSVLFSHLY